MERNHSQCKTWWNNWQ